MSREFYEARKMFRDYTGFEDPLSYEQWMSRPQEHKAAILYVQYFDQILLAWYKTKSFYASEEEGVETALQYLLKNVPIIESNPKRFNEKYIYRVSYNCLYCISHDRKCDRERFELEMSNVVASGEDEFDLFDTVASSNVVDYDDEAIEIKQWFWETIEDLGQDAYSVAKQIIDGGKLPKGVTRKRKEEIILILKDHLDIFKDVYGYTEEA